MTTSTYRAICQDCLRAPSFATFEEQHRAHTTIGSCVCGGDLCACKVCLQEIAELESGKREGVIGLKTTVTLSAWDADNGAVSSMTLNKGKAA